MILVGKMPVGYKTDICSEARDADPMLDRKDTSPEVLPGATMEKGPGLSKRTPDPLAVLAFLDFLDQLLGLFFMLGVVGELYR